jgi:Predicted tagatose 6-phosphate kinase
MSRSILTLLCPVGMKDHFRADTIAERSAQLCMQAEKTAHANQFAQLPVYVIGTEVPMPGGNDC